MENKNFFLGVVYGGIENGRIDTSISEADWTKSQIQDVRDRLYTLSMIANVGTAKRIREKNAEIQQLTEQLHNLEKKLAI